MVLMDGKVIGTWKRTFLKDKALITTTLFNNPSAAAKRSITRAAEQYGAFLVMPVELP